MTNCRKKFPGSGNRDVLHPRTSYQKSVSKSLYRTALSYSILSGSDPTAEKLRISQDFVTIHGFAD